MNQLYVINPCAGGKNHVSDIEGRLKALNLNAEVYVTKGNGDATLYVDDYCRKHDGEPLRIFACGGDGTLNEVVSGAVGHQGVEVGCYPCGSGNDYVKYWQGTDFHDIKAMSEAPSVEVDVMRVRYTSLRNKGQEPKTRYALNTMNYGFEAEVCRAMADVRRNAFLGGRLAYTTGIVKCLATGRHNPCRISVDGKVWREGDIMLASLANGRYAGGGFLCAPRSMNDDGLLEVTAITPISVLHFASIIKYYKNGEYLDRPDIQKITSYCRAQSVTIENDRDFAIGIDGEVLFGNHFEVENLHHALRFITAAVR
ncbi:MAG: hypothetical protein J6W88_01010 [Bacteroidales bacterium]|nr:hypothetical protein [Bacteroidales bacterium]